MSNRVLIKLGSTGSGVPASRSGGGFPFTPSANRSNPFDSLPPKPAGDRPLSLRGMMLGDSGPARSPSAGSHSSSSSGKFKPKMQPANPFFDNIRQNLELSHGGIIERIPLQLPPDARRRAHELPAWLCELVTLSDKEAADKLAQQFYTLERNEQLRLQALMDWHSKSSGGVLPATTQDDLGEKGKETSWAQQKKRDQSDVERLELWRAGQQSPDERGEEYYPFSITAGVERGTKNRSVDCSRTSSGEVETDNGVGTRISGHTISLVSDLYRPARTRAIISMRRISNPGVLLGGISPLKDR